MKKYLNEKVKELEEDRKETNWVDIINMINEEAVKN